MRHFRTVCRVGDVPKGESRMFVVDETVSGVFNIDGQFYALDDQCPHAGASLAHGYVEGDVVYCRIHHWGFCIRDGTYVDEPKPAFNARTYAVRLVGDEVQVEI